jgi:hypothetical protein
MPKIKLNLRSLTVPEKSARAREIVAASTGYPDLNAPHPSFSRHNPRSNQAVKVAP